jgi:cobyrinic acid a,c-diamide synthase
MVARIIIAGTHSGVGKTTLTAGTIAALRRLGLSVQPFKVGPDYIDPTYHSLAADRTCRNLDTWMVPPDRVRSLYDLAAQDVDIAVIEGVMGLFDGAGYDDETGSTAEVAKLLAAPVVVVIDASRMARSAAALALGCQRFDQNLPLTGFIVNRVAGEEHGRGVATAITRATGLPVLGCLPRDDALQVPERHLGLVPTREPGRWSSFIQCAADRVGKHVDLDALLAIAGNAVERQAPAADGERLIVPAGAKRKQVGGPAPVIAVARDEAFHFTYEDNLDLLRAARADIAFFSPLRDEALPARTAGIILSGGFPEVFAEPLAANRALHAALQDAHQRELPIYAECGGLMYLTEAIVDGDRRRHHMVGLLRGESVMSRRVTLGYRVAQGATSSWFLNAGETLRGHEFHYSAWEGRPASVPPAYFIQPRSGIGEPRPEGACLGNLWASYVHVHFGTMPDLAARFVAAARNGMHACHTPGGVR